MHLTTDASSKYVTTSAEIKHAQVISMSLKYPNEHLHENLISSAGVNYVKIIMTGSAQKK